MNDINNDFWFIEGNKCLPFDPRSKMDILNDVRKYKLYHDGSHYIARPFVKFADLRFLVGRSTEQSRLVKAFNAQYKASKRLGLRRGKVREYLKDRIYMLMGIEIDDTFINDHIAKYEKNMYKRKRLFMRRAFLNKWTHFVTVTYDDKKFTSEEDFRKKLGRCLSNMAYRHKWRYMYTFERAPETGRLHMHGLFYIPDGEMIGEFKNRIYYDFKRHNTRIACENSFFLENFGVNDFEEIKKAQRGKLTYIYKYVDKSGERMHYSRGIYAEIVIKLARRCLAVELLHDFGVKYVVFDDAIDWERDIAKFDYRQVSMFDRDIGIA